MSQSGVTHLGGPCRAKVVLGLGCLGFGREQTEELIEMVRISLVLGFRVTRVRSIISSFAQ